MWVVVTRSDGKVFVNRIGMLQPSFLLTAEEAADLYKAFQRWRAYEDNAGAMAQKVGPRKL